MLNNSWECLSSFLPTLYWFTSWTAHQSAFFHYWRFLMADADSKYCQLAPMRSDKANKYQRCGTQRANWDQLGPPTGADLRLTGPSGRCVLTLKCEAMTCSQLALLSTKSGNRSLAWLRSKIKKSLRMTRDVVWGFVLDVSCLSVVTSWSFCRYLIISQRWQNSINGI